jgi:hypothetical protein
MFRLFYGPSFRPLALRSFISPTFSHQLWWYSCYCILYVPRAQNWRVGYINSYDWIHSF